jgi:hypothetical protein
MWRVFLGIYLARIIYLLYHAWQHGRNKLEAGTLPATPEKSIRHFPLFI